MPTQTSHCPQPKASAAIDPSNPLVRGMCAAYVFGEPGSNRSFQNRIRPSGRGVLNATVAGSTPVSGDPMFGGAATRCNGTGYLSGLNTLKANAPYSVLTKFRLTGTGNGGIISVGATAGDGQPLHYMEANTGLVQVLVGDGASYTTVIPTFVAMQWYTIITTIDKTASGVQKHYLNGVQVATRTQSYGTVTTTNLFVGSGFVGVCPADYEAVYWWDRELTAAECFSVSNNPYQIFIPDRRQRSYPGQAPAPGAFNPGWVVGPNSAVIGTGIV